MKDSNQVWKVAFGVAAGVAVILFALLLNSNSRYAEQGRSIQTMSNQVQQAVIEIQDHRQSITNLETDLASRKADIVALSNTLETSQTELKTAQDAITKLEEHNQALETRAAELNKVIAGLTARIEEINQKLAAAEGDKAALTAELRRLTAEKEELVMKFNDLQALRTQVAKIKASEAVAQRLKWQRAGIRTTELKGAEKLVGAGAASSAKPSDYNLNVEVNSDGSIKTIPPIK